MNTFNEITPYELQKNPFTMIGKEWMLIAAEKEGKTNAMTASWGGMGVLWNKNVVFCFVRPQRYTKEFIDQSSTFSLSFFPENYRDMLAYFGRVSGRDEDKIAEKNLTVTTVEGTPCFEEASLTVLCKKLYAQDMTKESFIMPELIEKNYPQEDYHTLYVGEIVKIFCKEQ